MSSQSFKEFMARLQNDEGLKQELQAVGSKTSKPLEDVIAFAAINGYEITAEDIGEELTARELNAVTGGVTVNLGGGLVYSNRIPTPPPTPSDLINQLLVPPPNVNPSDRRLKSNILRVGTHPLGIGIYEYDIFGRRERGVMADEVEHVKPEAVNTHVFGIKMVNYAVL